jgi:hypothetical protein
MPDLPEKKVGIVACSGEELPEGTVTRLASLRVLEQLRPDETVTICLPLFLAGGEQDRAFARFYPTIAVDGCERQCAARGTEMHSGKPAAEIVITDAIEAQDLSAGTGETLGSARELSEAGRAAVDAAAEQIARAVDDLLGIAWDRRRSRRVESSEPERDISGGKTATCSCGSGIPIQTVDVNDQEVTLVALPLIFEQLYEKGMRPGDGARAELIKAIKIYNPVPEEDEGAYAEAVAREYALYCEDRA